MYGPACCVLTIVIDWIGYSIICVRSASPSAWNGQQNPQRTGRQELRPHAI